LEDAALQTLLIVIYPQPLPELVDDAWVQQSSLTAETAWTLYREVATVEDELQRLGPGSHRRLLASPKGKSWTDGLGGAVDVINNAGDIIGAIAKVAKIVSGP
jgi:hypothetical protein